MKILLIEPYFEGSHQAWAEGYRRHSKHEVKILSLPGRHWKWRMYGGAVSLAKDFLAMDFVPDLFLATDMLDLTTFLALSRSKSAGIPTALYFHENQITYPWSPDDPDVALQRNNQYGFINYTSALAADQIYFNSSYHLQSFTQTLEPFLKQFPDFKELQNIKSIKAKSQVLPLGLDLKKLDQYRVDKRTDLPVLLWNHRWEYDKNPELFFQSLIRLAQEKIDFKLFVLGGQYQKSPAIFAKAKTHLADRILHWGFAQNYKDYAHCLWQANLYPVTSNQDFFGGSVVEAIYCGASPLLPNRLAYPEHIPASKRKQHFYPSPEDFYQQLKRLVLDFEKNRRLIFENDEIQNFVARYDWSTLVPRYDQIFST